MRCDVVLERIVSGEPLEGETRAHLDACPSCAAAFRVVALADRRNPVALEASAPVPSVAGLENALRTRRNRHLRTGALLLVAAALLAVVGTRAWTPSVELAARAPSSEVPDLLTVLDSIDASLSSSASVPGTDAIALLNPYTDDESVLVQPLTDALMGKGDL